MAAMTKTTIVRLQQKHQIELNGNTANPDTGITIKTATRQRYEESYVMAYAHEVRNGFAGTANAGLVAKLAERFAQYKTYRATINELSDLNDRELSDLGISRSMIKRIAIETAYGA